MGDDMEYIILWILALFGLWDLISRIIESYYIENRGNYSGSVPNLFHYRAGEYFWKKIFLFWQSMLYFNRMGEF